MVIFFTFGEKPLFKISPGAAKFVKIEGNFFSLREKTAFYYSAWCRASIKS
jgi:hypothetical protein